MDCVAVNFIHIPTESDQWDLAKKQVKKMGLVWEDVYSLSNTKDPKVLGEALIFVCRYSYCLRKFTDFYAKLINLPGLEPVDYVRLLREEGFNYPEDMNTFMCIPFCLEILRLCISYYPDEVTVTLLPSNHRLRIAAI